MFFESAASFPAFTGDLPGLIVADIISSLFLLFVLFGVRALIVRRLRADEDLPAAVRRRYMTAVRNITFMLLVVGLFFIWSPALSTFALSLTALAVAIVLATKELILCLTGAFIRGGTDAFDIGDWIEVDGVEGEVSDKSLLATTVLGVDISGHTYTYTGRRIIIPNSVFLTHTVQQIARHDYIVHSFDIVVEPTGELSQTIDRLEQRLEDILAPMQDDLEKAAKHIRTKSESDFPDTAPSVTLSTNDIGKANLRVRYFTPLNQAAAIQRQVTEQVLADLAV